MKKELLIFGSNGALGKGVTKILSEKGFDTVYLFDLEFKQQLDQKNIKQIIIEDLSSEQNVQSAFNQIKLNLGSYYFLFSTIGGFFGGVKTWETKVSDFDKMININLKTNFLISKSFTKIIKSSQGGSICFTSAYAGHYSAADKSVYAASKAALSHLVKSLAEEGKKIKLSVNAIAPFIIDTPSNREWMKNENFDEWMKPEEIGELVFSIFSNFNYFSGNIIELKHRFNC